MENHNTTQNQKPEIISTELKKMRCNNKPDFGINAVMFTKEDEGKYSIDFTRIDDY